MVFKSWKTFPIFFCCFCNFVALLKCRFDGLKQDLDKRCEELIKQEFGVTCNFDVDDAVQKLEKLGIVTRVRHDSHNDRNFCHQILNSQSDFHNNCAYDSFLTCNFVIRMLMEGMIAVI